MIEKELICSNCSAKITGQEYWYNEKEKKVLCPTCRIKAEKELEEETVDPNIIKAVLLGSLAAIATALIWYGIVIGTGWMVGIIAILTGLAVGKSVVWGAGNKRGPTLQAISICLTAVSIIVAEYLTIVHMADIGFLSIGDFFTLYGASFTGNHVVVQGYELWFEDTAGFMQLIFYAIALWEAYSVPSTRKLKGQMIR